MFGKPTSVVSYAEKEVLKNQEIEEQVQKELAAASETEKSDEVSEEEPESVPFEKPKLEIPIEDVELMRVVDCRKWWNSISTPQ